MPPLGYLPAWDIEYFHLLESLTKNLIEQKFLNEFDAFLKKKLDPVMYQLTSTLLEEENSELSAQFIRELAPLVDNLFKKVFDAIEIDLDMKPHKHLANLAAEFFNNFLEINLQALEDVNPQVNIIRLDVNTLIKHIIKNPSLYNITHTQGRALDQKTLQVQTDVNQYIFYDAIHPTQTVHKLIAEKAQEILNDHSQ